ncbi:MAG: NUDIX hydrolase [Candidatus Nanohaloarchaea archaeon]
MIQLAGNIIIEDSKILLLYKKNEEHWEVPGGKVEENESPTQTAVREAKEEIGVEIELERPFYTGEFQHNDEIFEWNGYISSIKEGRPEIQEDKFEKLKWFSRKELAECDNLAPNIRMVENGIIRLL